MAWTVEVNRRIRITALPLRVQQSLVALLREIELQGPVRGNWPNMAGLALDGITVTSRKAVLPMWPCGK